MASNNVSPNLPKQYPFQAEIANESPGAQIAHRGSFQGILDNTQAIYALKSQIDALKPSTTTTTAAGSSTSGGSSTVIVNTTIGTVNSQTGTSYSTQQSDYGALIVLDNASAVALTLSTGTSIQVPWFAFLLNDGAGTVTATPATGTINGGSSLAITTNNAVIVFYDGTNFDALVLSGSAYVPQGGTSGSRPGSPITYQVYFDTTLGLPIWWTGSQWVNASGFGPV